MVAKKRFFKNTKKSVGNKSVNPREKKLVESVPVRVVQEKVNSLQEKSLFPKNPQIIAEKTSLVANRFQGKPVGFWIVLWGIAMVAFVSLVGSLLLVREAIRMYVVITNRMALQQEMHLWEDISAKYPTYRDANFQVAIFAYRLGDRVKEKAYLEKTLAVDPNFEPARRLAE